MPSALIPGDGPAAAMTEAHSSTTARAAYECNGQPIAREAFYAVACDPARSVAVEACAGAGKTWMLVSRMLRALLDGCSPHEILAITFTKKAAGEMRQRLQEWLEKFAHEDVQTLQKELVMRGISPEAALDKHETLRNLQQKLLASGRPVQIRTFHSWFAALLGTAPLALLREQGLPAHFELLEDDSEAVRRVWPDFLRAVAADAGLRLDYEAVVARHGRTQTHKALSAALSKRIEFALADAEGVVDASVPAFGAMFPEWAAFDAPEQALLTPAARTRWQARAQMLGAEDAKTPQKAAALIVDALACADPAVLLEQLRQALFVSKEDRLSRHLEKFPAAQEAEAELQRLLQALRQHQAWQHQQRMARLTRCLLKRYAAVKHAHGWVDMNDVERMALVLLGDPVLSGWVQERLDARVRHLLIDEFQDTNPLQWQALHAWLSAYVGSGGGSRAPSVFIVGDPKQSIYRFRRAEPQVFRAVQHFVRHGLGGDLLSCDHTHRNARGVIDAVNQVMLAAQRQGDMQGFRAHTTESQEPGAVLRLPPAEPATPAKAMAPAGARENHPEADPAAAPESPWRDSLTEPRHTPEDSVRLRECVQAAQWVAAQIAAGTQPKDVLVLARKRDRLSTMQEALRELHLPCVQPEKVDLYDAPEVQDIVALLDALVSTGHDLSLARALKSPLFGVSDALLATVAGWRRHPDNVRTSWFDLLQASELTTPQGQALAPILAQYKTWVDTLPPHDALHAIYTHGDVLARFAAAAPAPQRAAVHANLRALLAAALQHDGGRYLTPYAFVRAMKQGGVRAPGRVDAQAIRLLTVHGAKGLEADCVLLLDTDAAPQKPETMGVLVDWPGESAAPERLVFLTSENLPPPSVVDLLTTEQQARQREELNMLYVAMTRARRCLALSSVPARSASPGSWWNRLLPLAAETDVQPRVDAPLVSGGAAPAQGDVPPWTLAELPAWSAPVPGPEGAGVVDAAAPTPPPSTLSSRRGEAMHILLEQAGWSEVPLEQLRREGWPAARLARLAQDHELPLDDAHKAARMAQAILSGEGAWAWEPQQVHHAVNEASLRYQGQTLRIDRLVHRSGSAPWAGWWVLDYKSAADPDRRPVLVSQMRRYRAAVRQQMPGEIVHAAFLTSEGRLVLVDDEAPCPFDGGSATGAQVRPAAPGHTRPPSGEGTPAPIQGQLF